MQRAFGEEQVVTHVQRLKIIAYHAHHGVDGPAPHNIQRLILRLLVQGAAKFGGQRLSERHEIVARIEAGRDFANVLPSASRYLSNTDFARTSICALRR